VHNYRWPWTGIGGWALAWAASFWWRDCQRTRCPTCAPRPPRRRSDTDRSCAQRRHAGGVAAAGGARVAADGATTAAAGGGGAMTAAAAGAAAADHRWCRAPCGSSTAGGIYGSNVQLWCWYVVMWSGSIGGAIGSYQEPGGYLGWLVGTSL